jgi:formamidopyrimidine-DNA glycosylase
MPELPDVETFRAMVERYFKGSAVAEVTVHDAASLEDLDGPSLKRLLQRRPLLSAQRHGKFLFLDFDKQVTLSMHFGPAGSLARMATPDKEPTYSRLRLDFTNSFSLAYVNRRRIGRVRCVESVASFVRHARLGPDAIAHGLGVSEFSRLLDESRRPIKTLLTDQSKISGIGNTWSDEILFQSRTHPATPSASLTARQRSHLFRVLQKVLKIATIQDPTVDGFRDRLPPGFLLPHRHLGAHCPRCDNELSQLRLGGHTSIYCAHCQMRSSMATSAASSQAPISS